MFSPLLRDIGWRMRPACSNSGAKNPRVTSASIVPRSDESNKNRMVAGVFALLLDRYLERHWFHPGNHLPYGKRRSHFESVEQQIAAAGHHSWRLCRFLHREEPAQPP